jgi:hypothetical protein
MGAYRKVVTVIGNGGVMFPPGPWLSAPIRALAISAGFSAVITATLQTQPGRWHGDDHVTANDCRSHRENTIRRSESDSG